MEENKEQIIRSITERPNSIELGKAGNRIKLYFNNAADLNAQKEDLIALGLFPEDQ